MNIQKLLPHEFRKYFSRFNLLFLAAVLLLELGVSLYRNRTFFRAEYREYKRETERLVEMYASDRASYDAIHTEYEQRLSAYNEELMASDITKEIPVFESRYLENALYDDRALFSAVEKAVRTPETYQTKIGALLRDSVSRLEESDENTYLEKYYIALCERYMGTSDAAVVPESVYGWDLFFTDTASGWFLGIAMVVTLCGIFTVDDKAGMRNILHVCRYGGRTMIGAKLLCIVLLSAMMTTVFTLLPLSVLWFSVGLSSAAHPIQMLDAFVFCPFRVTVWQCLLLYLLVRVLLFSVFGMLLAVVNQILQSDMPSPVTAACIAASSLLIARIDVTSPYYFLQKYSVTELLQGKIVFERYRGVHFFGTCASYTMCVVCFAALLLLAIAALSLFSVPEGTQGAETVSVGKTARSLSLTRTEIYKQIVDSRYWILILCALMVRTGLLWFQYKPIDNYSERQYQSYIQSVSGDFTPQKKEAIDAEMAYIETSIAEYERAKSEYRAGNMEESVFAEYKKRYNYAEYNESACKRLKERSAYLEKISGTVPDASFIYEEGMDRLFKKDLDPVCIFLLVCMASRVFAVEYESAFDRVLRTAKNGRRRIFLVKAGCALLLVCGIYIVFQGTEMGVLTHFYDVDYWSVPIQSMPRFAQVSASVTVCMYFVYSRIVSLLGYISVFFFTASLSVFLRSQVKSAVVSLCVIAVPYICDGMSFFTLPVLRYTAMISPSHLETERWTYITCALLSLSCTVVAYRKWKGAAQ